MLPPCTVGGDASLGFCATHQTIWGYVLAGTQVCSIAVIIVTLYTARIKAWRGDLAAAPFVVLPMYYHLFWLLLGVSPRATGPCP